MSDTTKYIYRVAANVEGDALFLHELQPFAEQWSMARANLKDQAIRKALTDAGWTPPAEKQPVTEKPAQTES